MVIVDFHHSVSSRLRPGQLYQPAISYISQLNGEDERYALDSRRS